MSNASQENPPSPNAERLIHLLGEFFANDYSQREAYAWHQKVVALGISHKPSPEQLVTLKHLTKRLGEELNSIERFQKMFEPARQTSGIVQLLEAHIQQFIFTSHHLKELYILMSKNYLS